MNFDISQFYSYREDNRCEVKRGKVDFQTHYGKRILHLLIVMEALLSWGAEENTDGSWRMTGLENATKLRKQFLNKKEKAG